LLLHKKDLNIKDRKKVLKFCLSAGHQALSRGHRTLLEEGLSDVAVEVCQTREKTEKNQSEDYSFEHFVSRGFFITFHFIRLHTNFFES